MTGQSEPKRPLVSVIMPTYNHERYIAQALEGALMQDIGSMEILVGDDASSDRTRDILKAYAARYPKTIRLFLNERNVGGSRNACRLLSEARGMYLAACDGDDYWTDPHKLSTQVRFLEAHPELVGCAHYCIMVDEEGVPWRRQRLRWVHYKERFSLEDFQGMFLPGQPSTFLRRNVIPDIEDLSLVYQLHPQIGDRTLMCLFLLKGDFGLIHRYMGCYRVKRRDRNTVTQIAYRDKVHGWAMDYDMIKAYETLCRHYGREAVFTKGKGMIFVKACAWYILKRNKGARQLAEKIWKESEQRMQMLREAGVCIGRSLTEEF